MLYLAFLFLLVSAETANAGDVNPTPTSELTPALQSTPTPSPSGSAGCGKVGQTTGTFAMTISDGHTPDRSYILQVPPNYDPQVPLPIVMVFHGLNGTPQTAMALGIQDAPGASESAIFVFPQGSVYRSTTKNADVDGQVGWYDECGSVDMTFVKNILGSTEANYCVDEKRVFAAGFSWGCDFVTALNCCEGTLFRGISVASCTDEFNKGVSVADVNDPNYYLNYDNFNPAGICRGKGSAAIRFTHDSSGGDFFYRVPSFTQTSHLFRSMNSCSNISTPVDSRSLAPVTTIRRLLEQSEDLTFGTGVCSSFNRCASPFVECSYRKLGHALPANWGSDTWHFFSSLK